MLFSSIKPVIKRNKIDSSILFFPDILYLTLSKSYILYIVTFSDIIILSIFPPIIGIDKLMFSDVSIKFDIVLFSLMGKHYIE